MLHPFFQNNPVKLFNTIAFSKIQTPQGFIKKTNFAFKRCESTCNNPIKAFNFPTTTRESSLHNKENINKTNLNHLTKKMDCNFFKSKNSKATEKNEIRMQEKSINESKNEIKKERRRNNTMHVGTTKSSDLSPGFVKFTYIYKKKIIPKK